MSRTKSAFATGKSLGRTGILVLRLLADGEKDCRHLEYDWPGLTESAARSAIGRLADRGLVDVAGWKEGRRTYCLTPHGRQIEAALNGGETVTVRFIAQAWVKNNAIAVDAAGPTTFEVPAAAAQDAGGNWLPDHDHSSDVLREHDNAPEWIRNWSGPYDLEIEHEPVADQAHEQKLGANAGGTGRVEPGGH
jgi:DNA-binding HxlR family transcriptional regulator